MNPRMQSKEQLEMATHTEETATETERLARCAFTPEEIVSLLWLRQWYQSGGSDRAAIVRHLEFLRFLVKRGAIAL
jgi:hypothetical protein